MTIRVVLANLITIFLLLLAIRIILSIVPIRHDSIWSRLRSLCASVTDPVITPVRNIMPRTSFPLDLSTMLVWIVLAMLRSALLRG